MMHAQMPVFFSACGFCSLTTTKYQPDGDKNFSVRDDIYRSLPSSAVVTFAEIASGRFCSITCFSQGGRQQTIVARVVSAAFGLSKC